MDKVKLSYIFSREDLDPETALEVAVQATSLDEIYEIFLNLTYYFAKAIIKAKADVKVKADAILHLGEIYDAFSLAVEAFPMMAMLSVYDLTEERLYNYIKEHLIELARLYVDVKDGKPLEDVADKLALRAAILRALVKDTNKLAYLILRDKYNYHKERQSVTAEA